MSASGGAVPPAIVWAMRRALRIASVTLITAGLVILLDAGLTVVWQEPVSALYSHYRQNAASSELNNVRDDFLNDPEVGRILDAKRKEAAAERVDERAKQLADLFERGLANGQSIGRIRIPSIGADYVIVQGTDEADLQRGPGHYDYTALPGQGKTVAIAGHRTTYGAPFNKIDDIKVGDSITLEMPYATFTYRVSGTDIVSPTDVGIVDETGKERLVLTACHPLYSAAERYVIYAGLERVELAAR
jgi:sortase A